MKSTKTKNKNRKMERMQRAHHWLKILLPSAHFVIKHQGAAHRSRECKTGPSVFKPGNAVIWCLASLSALEFNYETADHERFLIAVTLDWLVKNGSVVLGLSSPRGGARRPLMNFTCFGASEFFKN